MTGLKKVSIIVVGLLALVLIGGCAITIGTPGQASTPTAVPLRTTPDEPTYEVVRSDLVETTEAVGRMVASVEEELYFKVGGRVITVSVASDDEVEEGQLLAEQDTGALKEQLAKAQVSLDIAQLRLQEKEDAVAAEREAAALDLKRAELSLEIAKLRLAQAQESPKEAAERRERDLLIAKNSVESARSVLEQAQAAYDRVSWRDDIGRLPQSRALQQAILDYEIAVANYEKLKAEPSPDYNLQILEKNVELAQLEVDRHMERVERPEEEDIDLQLLKKNVESAQVEVDRLGRSLAAAQIVAPFSGQITDLGVRVGDNVKAYEPVINIAGPGGIEAQARISIADLAWISVGNPVTIVKLGPVQEIFEGKVTYMPRTELGRQLTERESYTRFSIETPGADLKMGDVIRVVLILRQEKDVLIVPTDAVHSIRGGFYVQVWEAGRKKLVKIERGIVTADGTEVLQGLAEGQEVLGRR